MTRNISYLFGNIDSFSVRENQKKEMTNEISNYNTNKLLNTSVDDICRYFEEKYSVDVPELFEDQITANQQATNIDVSRDSIRFISDRSQPFYIEGTQIEITIPFSGENQVFNIRPSSYTLSPPIAKVSGNNLVIEIIGTDLNPEKVRLSIDRTIGEINSYLENLRSDFNGFNSSLNKIARDSINRRREKLLKDKNLVADLGFKLKSRDDQLRTYIAPSVRKKVAPQPPRATTAPYKPEPELSVSHYEHILNVIQNMAHVMERSPSAFLKMDEESLRTHFLVQLNGHFEGAATGETFNYSGKTDILIRVDGKNVFIGECKFWCGQKVLSETIDQLLGYSSWRDTKTAIIIFSKNKNFSAVIDSITPAVEAHKNFKHSLGQQSETSFRYVMAHKDDPNRELTLSVLAFDVPK